jgi:hypothetical protein
MSMPDDATRWRARADAILDVARGLAEGGPAPRGRPFFALDHPTGTPLALVEDLATRGIFRKYEHVLDLGAGLGATTRYLTTRLGCTATATASSAAEAPPAACSRRAPRSTGRCSTPSPTRPASPRGGRVHPRLDRRRAARAGPAFACSPRRSAYSARRPSRRGRSWWSAATTRRSSAVASSAPTSAEDSTVRGFLEIVRGEVDAGGDATPHRTGWSRLAHRLGADDALVRERDETERALAGGVLGLVQLTARRP